MLSPLVVALALAACPAEPGFVSTNSGCVRGHPDGNALVFLGIPYAAPPVGALRWHAPEGAKPWTLLDGTAFSKSCPQKSKLMTGDALDWSEDCLYLNVWTRKAPGAAKLPVM